MAVQTAKNLEIVFLHGFLGEGSDWQSAADLLTIAA
jgi:pimeloyl-ACP methyl ester carboxylesterase